MVTAGKTVVFTSFITNLILAQSLGLLWNAINALQMISHMSDFNAYVPANSALFHERLQDVADFELLPSEEILKWLGLVHLENTSDYIDESRKLAADKKSSKTDPEDV